jgi:alkanesulfonate monooxygenase SsuD/methylene tetrahydromethanopterin reductase-like flavin-dependent oxidoreductase (luciferase family)/pimeloyl-ACP methyl ester carboxylesterase
MCRRRRSRSQFWEAVDFIQRAWTEPGPFTHEGRHYPMRYVNPWPQPTQKPHPPIWIPGSRSRDTLVEIAKRGYCYFLSSRSHGKETARSQQLFAKILEEHGDRYQPSRMGILMSAYVADTDAQAQAEAKEGVWYFLKNCLKGHLRREGRQLTFGPGIPTFPPEEFRNFLKFSDPTTPLLGDAESFDDLQQSASIVVGSAETVYRRIMDILTHSKVGNLLIQFHLGNMQDALTRKSMHLFATEVAPRLREDSARLFAREFSRIGARAGDGDMSVRTVDVRGRKVTIAEAGDGAPLVYLHGFADVHGVAGDLLPFHQRLAQHARIIAPAHPGCNGSDELESSTIDDVIFRYLELFDAELLPRFDLIGHCAGGWIAAELAVRHPERVARLTLIGACGLFVPGEPIGDVFMHAQPERGTDLVLRALLFAEPTVRWPALVSRRPRRPRRGGAALSDAALRLVHGFQAALLLPSRTARSGSIARRCRRW